MGSDQPGSEAKFKIFRGAEAPDLAESGIERHKEGEPRPPDNVIDALAGLSDHGFDHRMLYAGNGLSLLHLWFKSGFTLPRHSHDTDCLYFVLAGSLRMGTEDLGPGDGFFVGADVPYTYTAGENGVEVLEFRAAEAFYLDLLVKNPAFWARFVDTMMAKQEDWPGEVRPLPGIAARSPA